jgi:hypothetical protein
VAQELISIFVCEKDKDIENFLKERAINFEKLGKSRTFFIFDEEAEEFRILAYFTIALQVLKVPEELLSAKKTKTRGQIYLPSIYFLWQSLRVILRQQQPNSILFSDPILDFLDPPI